MEQYNEFIPIFQRFLTYYHEMKNFSATNNKSPRLLLQDKIVLEKENEIYKISPFREGLIRVGLIQFAEDHGIQIFLSEKIVQIEKGFCIVTKQEKIPEVFNGITDEVFLEKLSKEIEEEDFKKIQFLFDTFHIMWYGNKNSGRDKNGKIKIFDFIANVGLKEQTNNKYVLTNFKGGIIFDVRI